MAIPVGSALGYAWGGQIEKLFGWRWAFYTVVPPGLLLAALCFSLSRPAKRGANPSTPSPKPTHAKLQDYLTLLRNPSYVLDCAGMTAMTFAIGGMSFFMPRDIAEYRNAGSLAQVN